MTILITAGPTIEPIDPVRYLTNRSSGKMGYALAEVAADHGHRVILLSGPTRLDVPEGVDFLPVETAAEMYDAVEKWISKADVAIFAAAVADYRMADLPTQKIKKSGNTMTLELVKNPDILGSTRGKFGFTGTLVGFAAETENVIANARGKRERKGCDLVVANDVSQPGIGFDSDRNVIHLVGKDGVEDIPEASKHELAHTILDRVLSLAK